MDASHFNLSPELIQKPLDADDVQEICKFCAAKKMTITARGAGTGLLGQSLSSGLILDFTANMNKIIDIEDDYVTAQPGLIKGVLDNELGKKRKFFPLILQAVTTAQSEEWLLTTRAALILLVLGVLLTTFTKYPLFTPTEQAELLDMTRGETRKFLKCLI